MRIIFNIFSHYMYSEMVLIIVVSVALLKDGFNLYEVNLQNLIWESVIQNLPWINSGILQINTKYSTAHLS